MASPFQAEHVLSHSLQRFTRAAAVSVLSCSLLAASLFAAPCETIHAEDYAAEQEARKLEPVQSSEDPSWPQGPQIGAEGAILLDAATGTVLYGKNIDEELYPASTTKMLTCLIAAETLDPDDTVTFSEEAIASVPADGSNVGMQAGETITVREALYAIMVGSANEVAAGIAEKISGSVDAFAELMNERAKELGCTHTHFVNANGLHDDNHYTSAHDLALIARAFFNNDVMITIGNTPNYHFTATATQPDDFYITNKHKLITGEVPCTGVIGGKTGYTGYARETLVTGCERGGMRLICVVMKEEDPYQYTDSADLLDWGFNNFTEADISSNETRFQVSKAPLFANSTDILGNSSDIFELTPDAKVILPAGVSFEDLTCEIHYGNSAEADTDSAETENDITDMSKEKPEDSEENNSAASGDENLKTAATLTYRYGNTVVGSADLLLVNSEGLKAGMTDGDESIIAEGLSGNVSRDASESAASSDSSDSSVASGSSDSRSTGIAGIVDRFLTYLDSTVQVNDSGTIYINIRKVLTMIAAAAAALILLILLAAYVLSFARPTREKKKRKQRDPMDPEAEHERPYRQYYDRYEDDDYDGKDLPQ